MKQNLNIEAEGSELILKNKAGDHVIIPKKYRREVQDMLKEGCHNCIDSLIETLPVMADYAQNGSIYPVDKNGKQIRKETYTQWGERIKKLAPNLDYKKEGSGYNYRGAYEGGLEPEYNKEDNSYHLGSRNPITGEILKSENHPSFKESVDADMAMGYETYRGKDGKIYSHDKKYLNANKDKVKEYLGTYNGNTIQAASVTADAPTWTKYRQEYIKNNSFNLDEYVENRFNNPVGREVIKKINAEGWKKELRQEGIEKRNNSVMDYVGEQLVRNKPQGKLSRAEWLNTMSDREESIIKRNPKYQSSLWADTKRGLASLVEHNPLQTFRNILNSSDYSNREKQEMLKDYTTHPIMSKLGDATKILSPLMIPTKMTQSTYKDNYSVLDAIKGKKNNAGIMEDIVTDPLNLIGAGLVGKLSKVDKVVDVTKTGSKVLNKTDNVLKQVDNKKLVQELRQELAEKGIVKSQKTTNFPWKEPIRKGIEPWGYSADDIRSLTGSKLRDVKGVIFGGKNPQYISESEHIIQQKRLMEIENKLHKKDVSNVGYNMEPTAFTERSLIQKEKSLKKALDIRDKYRILTQNGKPDYYDGITNRYATWDMYLGKPQTKHPLYDISELTTSKEDVIYTIKEDFMNKPAIENKLRGIVTSLEKNQEALTESSSSLLNTIAWIKEAGRPKLIENNKWILGDGDTGYFGTMGGFHWEINKLSDGNYKIFANDIWDLHPFKNTKNPLTKPFKNVEVGKALGIGKPLNVKVGFIVDGKTKKIINTFGLGPAAAIGTEAAINSQNKQK